MTEPRDPRIRAAMVELGAASREAPAWEQIEAESAGPGRAPAPGTPRPRRWAAAIRQVMGRRPPRPDEHSVPAVGSGRADAAEPGSNVTGRKGLLIAATAMAVALVIALPLTLLRRGGESPVVVTERTTTTTPTTPTTTLLPRVVAAAIPAGEATRWSHGPLVAVSAGEVWAGLGTEEYPTGLIGHLKDGAWSYWLLEAGGPVRGLAVAPDGIVWLATDAGVFSFDGGEWIRTFDRAAGDVAAAEDGSLWMKGWHPLWPARWDGRSWVRLDRSLFMFLPGDPAGPMAASPNGQVWIAVFDGHGDALLHCDGATCDVVRIGDYPEGIQVQVNVVEAAPNGDIWVGGAAWPDGDEPRFEAVLARFNGAEWTNYDLPSASASDLVEDLAVGPGGVLWLPHLGGLVSFDGTTWTARIEGQMIFAVDVAPDGSVWYADSEGLHTLSTP